MIPMNRARAPSPGAGRGFTLTEMLVVITVIMILAGLLLPALQRARRQGQDTACISNLGQFGKAIDAYGMEMPDALYYYPLWLTGMYKTEMGRSAMSYVCPVDPSRGKQGGRPDIFTESQYPETNDGMQVFTGRDGTPNRKTWVPPENAGVDKAETAFDLQASGTGALGCSYMYEWTWEIVDWGKADKVAVHGYDDSPELRWHLVKKYSVTMQRDDPRCVHRGAPCGEFDCTDATPAPNIPLMVPVVRCYWHLTQMPNIPRMENNVFNLRAGGDVSRSTADGWWMRW